MRAGRLMSKAWLGIEPGRNALYVTRRLPAWGNGLAIRNRPSSGSTATWRAPRTSAAPPGVRGVAKSVRSAASAEVGAPGWRVEQILTPFLDREASLDAGILGLVAGERRARDRSPGESIEQRLQGEIGAHKEAAAARRTPRRPADRAAAAPGSASRRTAPVRRSLEKSTSVTGQPVRSWAKRSSGLRRPLAR